MSLEVSFAAAALVSVLALLAERPIFLLRRRLPAPLRTVLPWLALGVSCYARYFQPVPGIFSEISKLE